MREIILDLRDLVPEEHSLYVWGFLLAPPVTEGCVPLGDHPARNAMDNMLLDYLGKRIRLRITEVKP